MRRLTWLAAFLAMAGCVQEAWPAAVQQEVATPRFEPFEADVEIPYAVMGGPLPMGRMAMVEAPVPTGATAIVLRVEWSPTTPAFQRLMVMAHAGTMERPGPMLSGAAGGSPIVTEPAFVPEGEASVVVMVMPEGEPLGAAVMQGVRVRLEFLQVERPPAPAPTHVDVAIQGTEPPWRAALWDVPNATESVLLVAGAGQSRLDWAPHALTLRAHGVRVMATDGLGPEERDQIMAAFEVLRALGSPRVVIAGASVGAAGALQAAASSPGCPSGLAEFSPVPDGQNPARPALALQEYGDRPLFLAVAQGDDFSYPAAQQHRILAHGTVTYVEVAGDAHGTDLLGDEGMPERFARWLREIGPCVR